MIVTVRIVCDLKFLPKEAWLSSEASYLLHCVGHRYSTLNLFWQKRNGHTFSVGAVFCFFREESNAETMIAGVAGNNGNWLELQT